MAGLGRSVRVGAAVLAGWLITGLLGCSASGSGTDRIVAAGPSTPSGVAVAPERPGRAEGLTLAAAEEFVRYYSDLLNYASATGDTARLLGESDTGCENCKSYADFVKKSNAANGLLTGDYREKVGDVAELVRGVHGRVGGSATIQVGRYVSRQTATASPFTSEATKYNRKFALSARGQRWVMFEMQLVEQ
ncbi:DUF6318 family protein [Kribbella sp. DT2]|uniref:DUF6318 family protein n=1 Tax=Kribbella sp. DT2 TaxID=3393427 RepID=UPI003CF3DCD9